MSVQQALAFPDFVTPPRIVGATHQERFEAFHKLNPWVADHMEAAASQLISDGYPRFSVDMLASELRFKHFRATRGDRWKVNKNHVSRYARLLLDRHPEWADHIETRELRAK